MATLSQSFPGAHPNDRKISTFYDAVDEELKQFGGMFGQIFLCQIV
jgi:hypothetical protein